MPSERKLRLTDDGSHTIEVPEKGLSYHSTRGAIQESQHVFIEAGLQSAMQLFDGPLRVFEMGFGTGLNAFLTAIESERKQRHILYTSLEAFPLEPALLAGLNYTVILGEANLFWAIHGAEWGSSVEIHPHFQLEKRHVDLLQDESKGPFHLIFFDAFAPDAQPELWTEQVFRILANKTVTGGLLTTYCSKGSVRRAMQAAGWQVHKLPGPPGKREMVRAVRI